MSVADLRMPLMRGRARIVHPDLMTDNGVRSASFPYLFSPLVIGGVRLRNRIFSAGHDTTLPTDGTVNDALIAYHRRRASGGVGLIVVQVAGVHETARYTSHMLMATSDACIEGYARLADACHAEGAVVFGQLFHPGREIMESADGSAPVAYSASAVPTERFHVMPRALPVDMIKDIIAGYGAAAGRLRAAGLDGVEIVASHGYLPAQFLSPRINLREDEYGGDPVRRLQFLREVIDAVRVTPGVIGLRISGSEMSSEGLQEDEVLAACTALDADGGLDYVNVTAGTSATHAGSVHIVPPMAIANAYTAPLSHAMRQAVSVPVLVGGRINQPQDAEKVLVSGFADACGMTRALICDPDLPNKAAAGQLDDIRACVACNQACIGHFHQGYPISCVQHPETGRELLYAERWPASRVRRVLVAGAGPAGLKAAAVAAERGHHVTICDSASRPGGQVLMAERLPGRAEFGGIAANLLHEATAAGVDVRMHTRVDRELVRRERPDVVVIATGARPRRPPLELHGTMPVLDAWQVLDGEQLPEGRIVVADWRCDWVGLGIAELLARAGHATTLCVGGYMPGQRIQQYVRDTWLASLARLRVEVIASVRIFGADDDTVYFESALGAEPIAIEDVAALVLAQGHVSVDGLSEELRDENVELHLIGDCLAPRTVEEAVLEGLELATRL
jgi:2,4-dienoyl-CoA reductase-like NADH-dependent reductase (Old Yellow Enzyme family)